MTGIIAVVGLVVFVREKRIRKRREFSFPVMEQQKFLW